MSNPDQIFAGLRQRVYRNTDRMFLWLLIAQWVFAIVLALVLSPYTYAGSSRSLHFHVKAAIGFGGLINALPIALIVLRPGWWGTRQAVAITQMLWSALFIMITGGRIETLFHVFGSLAFLAFYRDWRVLPTATIVVAADHLARGLWWPESVYGIANPEWWRFLEHAAWVAFEDIVLVFGCLRSVGEMRVAAEREAHLETTKAEVEQVVETRTHELKDSMERYRSLVENTDAIPFEYEPATHRVRYIAPQAARLLDCTLDDLVDDAFFANVLHPDDRERVRAAVNAFAGSTVAGGMALDYRMMAKTGRTLYVRTFLSSRADGGRVVRGVTLDMTKQKQLESELAQSQKLESVGRLAAGVAHEINTPMQFVSDSVQFVRDSVGDVISVVDKHRASTRCVLAGEASTELARDASSADDDVDLQYLFDQFPKALDRALDGLGRVTTIVRSMKAFAHPDQKDMSTVDLKTAIESTLTIARNEYKYVADIETRFADLPHVMCHGGEINQVILNILINAAHAIADLPGRTEPGKITIATRRDGDFAVISIADTGNGIPDTIRDRIFDPFFTTKEVGRGSGQGLSIARNIVIKHGGTLTFDSEIGSGTTFHIRLPIPAAELAA